MKKAIVLFTLLLLSINMECFASEQTKNRKSSYSKVQTALGYINEFNSQVPYRIIDNLYIISTKSDETGVEIKFKQTDGDHFVSTSIDWGVYNMIGYICSAVGLSETEIKRNGFNVKAILYDERNNVVYSKDMTAYDCLSFYNRQKNTPSLEPNLDSFKKYAEGLNKEAPQQVGEGITVTSVEMSGKKLIFNHSVSSIISQLFKERNNAREIMENYKRGLLPTYYEDLKDVLDFMEKEGIEYRYRLYEEGTNNMIYEMVITPQEIKRSHQSH